jgi:hypothetical protein
MTNTEGLLELAGQDVVEYHKDFIKETIPAVELPFDFERVDDTWKKYGLYSIPLLVRASDGTKYDDHKFKGLFRLKIINKKKELVYNKLAHRKYVVFPNEECDIVVQKFLDNYGAKFKLDLYKTHTGYNGDAMYWELRSKKEYDIGTNDKVQLGFIVRNSLACNVSFGVDLFTFRLVCQNGAISKGRDLLSLKIPHYGKGSLKQMYDSLYQRIHGLFVEGEELLTQYRIATKIKLRQAAAEAIAKKISNRYVPDYIDINPETHVVKIASRRENTSFWNVFNDVTESVWHNNALSFLTKADITNVMHYIMKNEIAVAAQ